MHTSLGPLDCSLLLLAITVYALTLAVIHGYVIYGIAELGSLDRTFAYAMPKLRLSPTARWYLQVS